MTADLIAFLRACLDDDERVARKCAPGPWQLQGEPRETYVFSPAGPAVATGWARDLEHIVRWDPARVLAEVAAKRAVLDAWQRQIDDDDPEVYLAGDVIPLALAQPYAGRPGWQDEWSNQ